MTTTSSKRSITESEDSSLSDSASGGGDEKTIPFLRRLRDMLLENDDVISFSPGYISDGKRVLGRLIVHDRLTVEAKVLPRYFNHSSFASLRRQLNYFSFVRVGKGRQRESTYINEDVVDLNDILHLKRRPASAGLAINTAIVTQHLETDLGSMESRYVDSIVPVVHLKPHYLGSTAPVKKHAKRQRLTPKLLRCDRSSPPATSSLNNFVSEDEHSETKRHYIALDLTKSSLVSRVDEDDVLAGCSALLGLARRSWE